VFCLIIGGNPAQLLPYVYRLFEYMRALTIDLTRFFVVNLVRCAKSLWSVSYIGLLNVGKRLGEQINNTKTIILIKFCRSNKMRMNIR